MKKDTKKQFLENFKIIFNNWWEKLKPELEKKVKDFEENFVFKSKVPKKIPKQLLELYELYRDSIYRIYFLNDELENQKKINQNLREIMENQLKNESDGSEIVFLVTKPYYIEISKNEITEESKNNTLDFVKKLLASDTLKEIKEKLKRQEDRFLLSEFELDLIIYKITTPQERVDDLLHLLENKKDPAKLQEFANKYGLPDQRIEKYLIEIYFEVDLCSFEKDKNLMAF